MSKRTYWTRSVTQSNRFTDGFHLPPEIWQQIFQHLPFDDLLEARLTCHRWLDLIGSCPALRDKFFVQFPHDPAIREINRNYKPPGTFPVANVCFKLNDYSMIGSINSWWPQVALTVTCLEMRECEFAVDMLEHTLNLKSLVLEFARISHPTTGNFQLMNLRKLCLKNSNPGPLRHMITRLEVLEIESDDDKLSEIIAMYELIASARRTLKEIKLDVPEKNLEAFSLLADLQLEKVFIEKYCFIVNFDAAVLKFVQANPSINDLTVVNPTVLHDVLRVLQNLKRLVLSFPYPIIEEDYNHDNDPERNVLPVIPNKLPPLEHLVIHYLAADIPLLRIQRGCRFSKLTKLDIKGVYVKGSSLMESLQHTSNLRSMTLKSCCFDSWNQLLSIIIQPKRLQSLRFSASEILAVESEPFLCSEPITSLSSLEIGQLLGIPSDKQRVVFQFYPRLTEVALCGESVDDDLVEEMCRSLPQLERLSVHVPGMTQKAATHLRLYGKSLKYLSVDKFWTLTTEDLICFTQRLESFVYRRFRMQRVSHLSILDDIKVYIDLHLNEAHNEEI